MMQMMRATVLALFIALSNAKSEGQGPSRLLLQAPAVQPYPQYRQPQYPQFQAPNYCNPYLNPYWEYIPICEYYVSMGMYNNYQYPPQQPPQPVVPSPVVPAPPVNPQSPATTAAVTPVTPVTTAAVNPPVTTAAVIIPPVIPLPVFPQPPATTAAVVTPPVVPVPPVNPPPVTPGNPVNPPPVGPVVPNPGVNPGLIPGGVYPGMPGMYQPPLQEINCGPFPPATLCANRRGGLGGSPLGPLNINGGASGLADNFKLYCDTPMACSGSEINIDLRPNPMNPMGVRQINQLLFSEAQSGANTVVNIRNEQMNGNNVELSNLECSTIGSCAGLKINGWGISLNDVNCPDPQNCMGCIFNNYKTVPDMFCPQPMAPDAVNNPGCLIEATPCFGY